MPKKDLMSSAAFPLNNSSFHMFVFYQREKITCTESQCFKMSQRFDSELNRNHLVQICAAVNNLFVFTV